MKRRQILATNSKQAENLPRVNLFLLLVTQFTECVIQGKEWRNNKMEIGESLPFESLFGDYNFENAETVLPVVRKCLKLSQNETEIVRALEVALCYCLKNFSPQDLEEELFESVCPAAKNFVLEKLKYLEKTPEACFEYLTVILKVIACFQGVFEYLSETEKLTFIEVKSLLTATCEILHGCYSHCKISEDVYGSVFNSAAECLSNFFKNCCSLQEQLLTFICEKSECDAEDDRELLLLEEVLNFLSKSGILLIHLEVKTMARVWKTFAFLIQKYLSFLKSSHNIGETITELSSNITSNMEAALCKSGEEDVSKVVKLSCFLLKLVIKFCEEFKGYLKDCQQTLLNLLLMFCKCDACLTDQSQTVGGLHNDMLNQLTIGIDPLISQLMSDEGLVKECHELSKDADRSPEFVILCCVILKKLMGSDGATRGLWFNKRENILHWVFHSASTNQLMSPSRVHLPSVLVNGKQKKFTDLYEYVLVSASAFIMTATSEEYILVEETFLQNVLQKDPIRALLAIDMWCLMGRFADSKLCLAQCVTLGKLYQEFDPQTSRPEKWYLGSLIRRLFPLLTESHKGVFLKAFPPSFYSTLWGGRKAAGLPPNVTLDISRSVLSEIDHFVDQESVESFTLDKIRERTTGGELHGSFGERIVKLWKFDCEVLSSTSQSVRFLKILCLMTACVVSKMPSESLLLVLSQVKKLLTIGQATPVNLYITCIINALASVTIPPNSHQKKIITAIADAFRLLLSTTRPLAKEKAFSTFFSFSHVTSHAEIISLSVYQSADLKLEVASYFKRKPPDRADFRLGEYARELARSIFVHACEEEEPDAGVVSKKMRMWPVDAHQVVDRWREDGKKLLEYYQALSQPQKREIKNICSSILSLSESLS